MNDKQITINDIDISECELYRDDNGVFAPDGTAERTELCYLTNDYCAKNPNCYYKQLKHKEQECEELKKDVEHWKSNFNGKVSAIEELIKIIQQALEDFSIEVGTPQYDRLLNSAKSLGIEVDNGTNP